MPPKVLACIRFLHKVKHKTAVSESSIALRRLNLTFTTWTIFKKFGTLVHHGHGYKRYLRFFIFCLGKCGLSKPKKRGKIIAKL